MKQILFILLLSIASSAWAVGGLRTGAAATSTLVETMSRNKQEVAQAEAEKRRILGSLYSIQKRMKKISNDKSHLTDDLFQAQDGVRGIAKVIAKLEAEISKEKAQLRRRLRALYKMSGQGYIAILFSRKSVTDLDETLRFMKIVTDSDYRLIRSYRINIATQRVQKEKLKAQVERLVVIEKRIKKQEGLLAVEQESKSKIVADLDRRRSANLAQIKSIRQKTQGLMDDEVAKLLRPSIYEQKGALPVPYASTVSQDFGSIADEKYKIRYSHKGWLYVRSPTSSDVVAVFDGVLVKSQWVPGYGLISVIDHGDHYYSVYGHLTVVKLKPGDSLKKGQMFAKADGPKGLYFELRHFSDAENPARWLVPQNVSTAQSATQLGASTWDGY